jgi:short chain dehydrogenase
MSGQRASLLRDRLQRPPRVVDNQPGTPRQPLTIVGRAAQELSGTTALVTGASRVFGRGSATALAKAGAQVAGVAGDRARLEEVRAELGESFTPVAADAANPTAAGQLIDAYHPASWRSTPGPPRCRAFLHPRSERNSGPRADSQPHRGGYRRTAWESKRSRSPETSHEEGAGS